MLVVAVAAFITQVAQSAQAAQAAVARVVEQIVATLTLSKLSQERLILVAAAVALEKQIWSAVVLALSLSRIQIHSHL
jgi:hypothetical protein